MNIFFVIRKKGADPTSTHPSDIELVTPPLTRGDILPGINFVVAMTVAVFVSVMYFFTFAVGCFCTKVEQV